MSEDRGGSGARVADEKGISTSEETASRKPRDDQLMVRYEGLVWTAIEAAESSKQPGRKMAWMKIVSSMMRSLGEFRAKENLLDPYASARHTKEVLEQIYGSIRVSRKDDHPYHDADEGRTSKEETIQ